MLDAGPRQALLELARGSLAHGIAWGTALEVELEVLDPVLAEPGASFVSLHLEGRLRGCVGLLEAARPLAMDVAENAFAAGLRDPRFAPLSALELETVEVSISVLEASEALPAADLEALLTALRPGEDGLIVELAGRRATFLPAVWEQLPDPSDFVTQLWRKAGLPVGFWSPELRLARYRSHSFSEADSLT